MYSPLRQVPHACYVHLAARWFVGLWNCTLSKTLVPKLCMDLYDLRSWCCVWRGLLFTLSCLLQSGLYIPWLLEFSECLVSSLSNFSNAKLSHVFVWNRKYLNSAWFKFHFIFMCTVNKAPSCACIQPHSADTNDRVLLLAPSLNIYQWL